MRPGGPTGDHDRSHRDPPVRLHGPAGYLAYIVMEYRGGGAHTAVYGVRREGRDYALKILRDAVTGDSREEIARAFRREAAVLACIHHHAPTEIHEVGLSGGAGPT